MAFRTSVLVKNTLLFFHNKTSLYILSSCWRISEVRYNRVAFVVVKRATFRGSSRLWKYNNCPKYLSNSYRMTLYINEVCAFYRNRLRAGPRPETNSPLIQKQRRTRELEAVTKEQKNKDE